MKKHIHIIILIAVFVLCFQYVAFSADIGIETELNKMISYYKDSKYKECVTAADSILKLDNSFMEAYKYKALAYFKQKKYETALEILNEQLSLNPNNEYALYNSACLYSILDDEENALKTIKKILELDITNKRGLKTDSDFDKIRSNDIFRSLAGISVRVGGRVVFFDVPPITVNDRTMVPLRGVFEALGAEVTWNNETKTVTAIKGKITLTAGIGSNTINVNGKDKEIDTAPVLVGDRTLVPVRLVSESLGADVFWNENDQIVDIYTKAPQGNANYDAAKKQLDEFTDVSFIDGKYSEPYMLNGRRGKILIIAKDKKGLDLMHSLTDEQRINYMNEKTKENLDSTEANNSVYMEFISEGKAYYKGIYEGEKKYPLSYYENGLVVNAVIQDIENNNYRDYYKEAI